MKRPLIVSLLVLTGALRPACAGEGPDTLFLTWQDDPTTTMSVRWIEGSCRDGATKAEVPVIRWRKASGDGWSKLPISISPFAGSQGGRASWSMLYSASWRGLEPGTDYVFAVGDSPEMKFRTAPAALGEKLSFAEGGDADVGPVAQEMIALACLHDPLFFSVGGDIAYSNGRDAAKEIAFWKQWHKAARTRDGRLVPIVAGIGNHEVQDGYCEQGESFKAMRKKAPFFYALFGGLYRTGDPVALDFGDYLSLLLLDSGHVTPMKSQDAWLARNLASRRRVPWVFASWHVASYPSARFWTEQPVTAYAREHWIPILESSSVAAVFNHHDHNLQRVETEGSGGRRIMVFGNGCIGVEPRGFVCRESARLALKQAEENYVNLVSLTPVSATVRSLGRGGVEIDRAVIPSPNRTD